jgi:DNA-binding MarR family transcriptional regulator
MSDEGILTEILTATLTTPILLAYYVYFGEVFDIAGGEGPGLLVNKLAHAMSTELDRRLRAHEVTMSQWALLKQLWRQEGRSQVELQALLGLEGATVTGLVQRMTRVGLVSPASDPRDRRVQRVYLTEQGRALEQVTTVLEQEVNARALEGFSDDERAFFIRLLMRALKNMQG